MIVSLIVSRMKPPFVIKSTILKLITCISEKAGEINKSVYGLN